MDKIQFKRPELEDQEIIHSYFEKSPSRSCERTFANVYLWSRHYKVEYAIIEGALVFKDNSEKALFAYPAGDDDSVHKAIEWLNQYSNTVNAPLMFYNVTEENFAQLEGWYPGVYKIQYDPDQADYVYDSEKLMTLAGKKLHGKRNHINKFKSLHENWSYEKLNEDNVEECFQMALKWRTQNGCDEDVEKNAEMCVTLNSLRLYKELGLIGGALRAEGKIVAFTIGEPMCEDTFVVHIEKAFADVDGAYPMINQQFVQHECTDYAYINREDDAGSAGLRKAKLSYQPAFMVQKGFVTKK